MEKPALEAQEKRSFRLGNLVNPMGRSCRWEFIVMWLPLFLLYLGIQALVLVLPSFSETTATRLVVALNIVIAVFGFLPTVYVIFVAMVRRFHDLGRSGWWSLLALIPLVNLALLVYLAFAPGQKWVNKWGI